MADRWVSTSAGWMRVRVWQAPRIPADPAIVLVHGLGVASAMSMPLAGALAPSHHVYAPDLPGFGDSDKPAEPLGMVGLADVLAEGLQGLGLDGTVLVGTSVGCQIAAHVAARHPRLCDRLVLGSPTVDRDRRRWRSQLWRWQAEQATQSLRMRRIQLVDYAKAGIARVIHTFSSALDDRIEDTLGQVRQPLLVCWGTRDPLVSRGWAEHLAHVARNGDFAVLPGAVHNLSHERPREFARVIERFLASSRVT